MNWQVQALVEVIGVLRRRLALLCAEGRRERAELEQKLLAAKDALTRCEANQATLERDLVQSAQEISRLKDRLLLLERERDEARRLLADREDDEPAHDEGDLGEAGA